MKQLGDQIAIRIRSADDTISVRTISDLLGAMSNLLHAVAAEVAPGVEIDWALVDLHYECEGCAATRPVDHPDWIHLGDGTDLCAACAELVGC